MLKYGLLSSESESKFSLYFLIFFQASPNNSKKGKMGGML